MPLPLGHAAIGIATHTIMSNRKQPAVNWQALLWIVILSNLPDIDVLPGLILQNNGSAFHRGPTHSILFALAVGYAVHKIAAWLNKTPVLGGKICSAIVLSHVVADYFFTTAPVSFFWPSEVYWSTGSAQWQQVVHAVIFEAAKDGAIVIGGFIIVFANAAVRRLMDKKGRERTPCRNRLKNGYPFSIGGSADCVSPALIENR